MNKKLTPHIIAVNSLVVFIVLGLACATAPKTPPQNFRPPMPLTQSLIGFDNPRMPPDQFRDYGKMDYYWYGTLASENFTGKLGFFATKYLYDISVDGVTIYGTSYFSNATSLIGLTPGKHTLKFTYKERRNMSYNTYLDINYSMTMEVDIQSGKAYRIYCSVSPKNNMTEHNVMVHGYGSYNLSFSTQEVTDFSDYKPPAFKVGIIPGKDYGYTKDKDFKVIYLEPHDSNVPLESQSFLELRDGIYIVGFDGNAVSWGAGKDYRVTIGIPMGKHELQLANLDKSILYTMTLDAFPQHRYRVEYLDKKTIIAADLTKTYSAIESGKFTRPK